ncbi:MAG: hypothetical protein BWY82_00782 [Verrucomicrobia bacterium ADurb.Bin474]|nr:MAG: hypothetical protein BWY82_00782 [Verrucomicrobia bacterium ADurb.Bin474]
MRCVHLKPLSQNTQINRINDRSQFTSEHGFCALSKSFEPFLKAIQDAILSGKLGVLFLEISKRSPGLTQLSFKGGQPRAQCGQSGRRLFAFLRLSRQHHFKLVRALGDSLPFRLILMERLKQALMLRVIRFYTHLKTGG